MHFRICLCQGCPAQPVKHTIPRRLKSSLTCQAMEPSIGPDENICRLEHYLWWSSDAFMWSSGAGTPIAGALCNHNNDQQPIPFPSFLHWKTLYASGVFFSYHQPETILFFSECLNLLVVLLHFFMNEHQDLVPCPPLVLGYSLKLIIPYTKHVVVHVMKPITTFSI